MPHPKVEKMLFGFKGPGLGRIGVCSFEVHKIHSSKALVVFHDDGATGCGPLMDCIDSIASQFRMKHLRGYDPAQIIWIVHTPGATSTLAGGNGDEGGVYQKVQLTWDGERYSLARQMARFNRGAFVSIVGEDLLAM